MTALSMWIRASSVWVLFDLGKWDELLRVAKDVQEWSEASGSRYSQATALPFKARVLEHRGRYGEASELIEGILPFAREAGDLQVLVPALAIGAQALASQGKTRSALKLVEELIGKTLDRPTWRARHLVDLTRVLVSLRRVSIADELMVEVGAVATTRDSHAVTAAQAHLAEAHQKTMKANELYAQAARGWADFGFVPEEGRAHLGQARCLLALGDAQAAIEPLQTARAIFSRLGAVPLIDETDRYFQQAE